MSGSRFLNTNVANSVNFPQGFYSRNSPIREIREMGLQILPRIWRITELREFFLLQFAAQTLQELQSISSM